MGPVFRDTMAGIVDACPGATAAVLMGFDGIAVETYAKDGAVGPDATTVGMEFSFLLGQVRKAAETIDLGAVEEVTVKTPGGFLVLRVLTAEYFLALLLSADANFGKARYLTRLHADALAREL